MTSRPRDKAGVVIFKYYRRPGDTDIQATDARLIGQIDSTYISATNRDSFSSNIPDQKLVITTPNADYLPSVRVGNQIVALRTDGRWGANDWSQWPQWYFAERDHFPYILRRPSQTELPNHPLRLLWFNMEAYHFVSDEGLNAGLLMSNISTGLYDIRVQLMNEVKACVCGDGQDHQKLNLAAAKMRAYTSALRFTPQPFESVLLTVAAAQRYCLETRAMLDKIKKWDPMTTTSEQRPADSTIMGCVTDSAPVAYLLHEKGVPVWFVRSLSQLPDSINIIEERPTVRPAHVGIVEKYLVDGHNFYVGPISPVMLKAIENWKPGALDFRLVGKGIPSEAESNPSATNTNLAGSSCHVETLPRAESSGRVGIVPRAESSPRVENPNSVRGQGSSSMTRRGTTPYPTSGRAFQGGTGPTVSLNLDLLKPSTSPQMPRLLAAWRDALTSIKVDFALLVNHPNRSIFRGFAFPPSHIFCGDKEPTNVGRMLAWIVVRTGWMATFADPSNRDIPLPNPQNWRDYFHDVVKTLEFTRANTHRTPNPTAAVGNSRSAKTRETTRQIFTSPIPPKESLPSLTWHGYTVWRPGHIDFPLFYRKSLMWDIQEHNFRLELLTLDRCLLPTVWGTTEGAAIRDQKFNELWPNDVILMETLPTSASGISAEDWQVRAPFVEVFRQIVMGWPGEIPQQLSELSFGSTVNGTLIWNRAGMERVEGLAAQHFCQVFFDYFARPPCLPHIFPVA